MLGKQDYAEMKEAELLTFMRKARLIVLGYSFADQL